MWESRKSPGLIHKPFGNEGLICFPACSRYHRRVPSLTIEQAAAIVESFDDPSDLASLKSRDLTLLLLLNTPSPFSRHQFAPGHLTATGLVLAQDGERVLLVHHAKLNRWLLPGGHLAEHDNQLWKTARREVIEETGVLLRKEPAPLVGLDVHGIPPHKGEPYHLHHDLVFHFRAESDDYRLSYESRAIAWAHPDLFEFYELPSNVRLAYQRVRELTAKL
jgi:8-oxo-dGTP pyrophosphatase MutT (NUDIX family)